MIVKYISCFFLLFFLFTFSASAEDSRTPEQIKKDYLVADLIRDLDLEIIIVTRISLGTINHTLLTINQARTLGLVIKGLIFNQTSPTTNKIAEDNNPQSIKEFAHSQHPCLKT